MRPSTERLCHLVEVALDESKAGDQVMAEKLMHRAYGVLSNAFLELPGSVAAYHANPLPTFPANRERVEGRGAVAPESDASDTRGE